jgi:hypothetical protein
MAQTFDIRFARSGGMAAYFEAAGNSFGWRGGGRLSIDAQGMSFALGPGISTLLTRRRSQRVPAAAIKEVYREGTALRVEFASDENPRTVLPFWASSQETAAQIVQLAPTSRTFEVEHGPAESDARKRRSRRWIAPVIVSLLGFAVALLFTRRPVADGAASPAPPRAAVPASVPATQVASIRNSAGPDRAVSSGRSDSSQTITAEEAGKLAMLAEDPVDWTAAPARSAAATGPRQTPATPEEAPAVELDAAGFVPMEVPDIGLTLDEAVTGIPRTTLAYRAARELLAQFTADAAGLSADLRRARARFDAGGWPPREFAGQLDALAGRWLVLNERLLQNRKYQDSALDGLRSMLMSVVIEQRLFLAGYGAGLRSNDQATIERAFLELTRAEQLLAHARRYVD